MKEKLSTFGLSTPKMQLQLVCAQLQLLQTAARESQPASVCLREERAYLQPGLCSAGTKPAAFKLCCGESKGRDFSDVPSLRP